MITFATLGENLMRQYPVKKKKKLVVGSAAPHNTSSFVTTKLEKKAIDKGTFGSTDKAWYDKKKKKYSRPRSPVGGNK